MSKYRFCCRKAVAASETSAARLSVSEEELYTAINMLSEAERTDELDITLKWTENAIKCIKKNIWKIH
jgi:hypothetical protein